jgi:ribosomal protein S18 acetylase RimI-like enzyme
VTPQYPSDSTPSGWDRRMFRSVEAFLRIVASGSEGGRMLELGGVAAALTAATPTRSVFNSVIYERSDSLAAALGALAKAYEDAGVRAWTVWVPESDADSQRLLESAGHKLDASPRAMILDLEDLPDPQPGDLDWDADAPIAEVCRINDLAYGDEPGTFHRALGKSPAGAYRFYRARLNGEPAAVVGTRDHEGDCGVYWVAALPESRGRGLVGRLMHLALAEGRERGCDISTLQATTLGYPVYARLGYRDVGALQMWERRS